MADISKVKLRTGGTEYNIKDASAYRTGDSADTTIDNADTIPFYDTSATTKKKITVANLKTAIGGSQTFAGLADVQFTNLQDGQLPQYSASLQKWVNGSGITPPPDGSTVTPTDNIQTWLACAAIQGKSYTTLTEVLADNTTLIALLSSDNAVDYMVRSTTWVSDICANSLAMTGIGSNNYCANALLGNSTWRTAICNSTYFESVLNVKVPTMSGSSTPSGVGTVSESSAAVADRAGYKAFDGVKNANNYWQTAGRSTNNEDWIEFTFPSAVKIYRIDVSAYKDASCSNKQYFKLMASNDNFASDSHIIMDTTEATVNSDLTELNYNFANSGAYTSYRLYQSYSAKYAGTDLYYSLIHESQFYGRA